MSAAEWVELTGDIRGEPGCRWNAAFAVWFHSSFEATLYQFWDYHDGWYWGLEHAEGSFEEFGLGGDVADAKQPKPGSKVWAMAERKIQEKLRLRRGEK